MTTDEYIKFLGTLMTKVERAKHANNRSQAEDKGLEALLAALDAIYPQAAVLPMTPPTWVWILDRYVKLASGQEQHVRAEAYTAIGFPITQFHVLKASHAMPVEKQACQLADQQERAALRKAGVLVDDPTRMLDGTTIPMWVFARDYTFESPTKAASVICGGVVGGPANWKDKAGKPMTAYPNYPMKTHS